MKLFFSTYGAVLRGALTAASIAGLFSVQAYRQTSRYNWCTDNQEFYLVLMNYAGLASCLAIVIGMLTYHTVWFDRIQYGLNAGLRYALCFFIFAYAIQHVMDIKYTPDYISLDYRLSELSSYQFVHAFFGHNYGYQAFLGWAQIAAGGFLFFRQTSPLGLVMLVGITINMWMIDYHFTMCTTTEAGLFLLSAGIALLPYAENILNTLVFNKSTTALHYPFLHQDGHGYRSIHFLKILVIMGILFYYNNQLNNYRRYYLANADSPFLGVWKVDEVHYNNAATHSEETAIIGQFRNFYLEEKRLGAVKVGDSISYFEYLIDTTYNQMEFWNFHDFKSLDLKGRYKIISHDTLLYEGRNGKDTLEMKLVLDQSYPKLR